MSDNSDLNTDLSMEEGGGGFGLAVALGAYISTQTDTLKAELAKANPLPLRSTAWGTAIVVSGQSPTLVTLTNTLGPAKGRAWNLRSVGLYGNDGHTSVAAAIAEFYSGDIPDAGGASMPLQGALLDAIGPNGVQGVAVPYFFTLPNKALWVSEGESVYALVYGAVAPGQQLVLIANYEDYEECQMIANSA
jgi:hypothetical protein